MPRRSGEGGDEDRATLALRDVLRKHGLLGCMWNELNTLRIACGLQPIDRDGYIQEVPCRAKGRTAGTRSRG